jgi:hypothetical protein
LVRIMFANATATPSGSPVGCPPACSSTDAPFTVSVTVSFPSSSPRQSVDGTAWTKAPLLMLSASFSRFVTASEFWYRLVTTSIAAHASTAAATSSRE